MQTERNDGMFSGHREGTLALPSGQVFSYSLFPLENTLKLFSEMGSVSVSLRYSSSYCPEATASTVPILIIRSAQDATA
jgi:hypothetical protein